MTIFFVIKTFLSISVATTKVNFVKFDQVVINLSFFCQIRSVCQKQRKWHFFHQLSWRLSSAPLINLISCAPSDIGAQCVEPIYSGEIACYPTGSSRWQKPHRKANATRRSPTATVDGGSVCYHVPRERKRPSWVRIFSTTGKVGDIKTCRFCQFWQTCRIWQKTTESWSWGRIWQNLFLSPQHSDTIKSHKRIKHC